MGSPDPAQYDVFADAFQEHAAEAPYNALYDRPATSALLGPVAGRRVLDAACGPGFYLEELVARGADVVGCDASPRMVELARRRLAAGGTGGTGADAVDLRVQSLDEPLGWLADGSVDVVLCALAYHYLNDRPAFLGEARRVLAPTGALVISTHHPTDDWCRLGGSYFEVGTVTERWSRGWDITAWRMPLTRITEEFAAAGFLIERLVEPLPQPGMAQSHPDVFDRLSRQPAFVLFRLRPAL